MSKIVIWDLFGGGQNSVYNALKNQKIYDIYTFDITEPTRQKHFKIDLSQNDITLVLKNFAKLNNIPWPDIVLSSPLCQSFSCVLNMRGGGTCFWKLNNNKTKLILRSKKEFEELKSGFTKNLDAYTQLFNAKLGKKCIDNTIEIIKYFGPNFWYIENPKNSLIWKYIKLNRKDFYNANKMHLNETSYGKYGFLITKPTIFLSNKKLNLLKGKIEPPYTIEIINGIKYYVLKLDKNIKVPKSLDSRMIGLLSLNKMLKARNVNSGMGGMDFIMKHSTNKYKKNKKTTEQIREAGPASYIPYKLIKEIIKHYN